jgi:hypothetical protein
VRYVEITHTYVIGVPADEVEGIDTVANAGVSMMEGFMKARASAIMGLRSDWKLMPKEYYPQVMEYERPQVFTDTPQRRDSDQAKRMIEADIDQGVSFTRDVMGQDSGNPPHPWDQGLRVVPAGHELYHAETIALAQQKRLCGEFDHERDAMCIAPAGHPGDHTWAPAAVIPEIEQ